jgi:hypothetical protein
MRSKGFRIYTLLFQGRSVKWILSKQGVMEIFEVVQRKTEFQMEKKEIPV